MIQKANCECKKPASSIIGDQGGGRLRVNLGTPTSSNNLEKKRLDWGTELEQACSCAVSFLIDHFIKFVYILIYLFMLLLFVYLFAFSTHNVSNVEIEQWIKQKSLEVNTQVRRNSMMSQFHSDYKHINTKWTLSFQISFKSLEISLDYGSEGIEWWYTFLLRFWDFYPSDAFWVAKLYIMGPHPVPSTMH